jgi:hypothetical protein
LKREFCSDEPLARRRNEGSHSNHVSPRAEHPQAPLSTAGWRRRGGAI